jgi:predicted RNase H-like nuclease
VIESRPSGVGRDDVLDAMAVCWTAERVLRKKEIRVPGEPVRDSRGLRMEIVR